MIESNGTEYNEQYYEHGSESGVSCYSNYRWLPELTIPMAHTISKYLNIENHEHILDFGCAKGYLVHAMRLIHHQAWGYDISEYALNNAHPDVKPFVTNIWPVRKYDWLIAKDVLEHIDYSEIDALLAKFRNITSKIFCVIPLGNGVSYNIKSYDLDKTHKIKEDHLWWRQAFLRAGFSQISYTMRVPNLKENYSKWPDGNIFIQASSIMK